MRAPERAGPDDGQRLEALVARHAARLLRNGEILGGRLDPSIADLEAADAMQPLEADEQGAALEGSVEESERFCVLLALGCQGTAAQGA